MRHPGHRYFDFLRRVDEGDLYPLIIFTSFIVIVTAVTTLLLANIAAPKATTHMCQEQYDPSYFIVHAGANGGADFCTTRLGDVKYPKVEK